MDFTYLVALFLSVIVGFASALVFAALRGKSLRRLFLSAVAFAVAVDFALLIDWGRWEEITANFIMTDAVFFLAYAVPGTAVGALPVLGLRWLYRRLKAEGAI